MDKVLVWAENGVKLLKSFLSAKNKIWGLVSVAKAISKEKGSRAWGLYVWHSKCQNLFCLFLITIYLSTIPAKT